MNQCCFWSQSSHGVVNKSSEQVMLWLSTNGLVPLPTPVDNGIGFWVVVLQECKI